MYELTILNQNSQELKTETYFVKETAINHFIDLAKELCYPIEARGEKLKAGGEGYDFLLKLECF